MHRDCIRQYNTYQDPGSHKTALLLLLLLIGPIAMYFLILDIYFPHGTCKTGIGWSHKIQFWDMMDYVKEYDILAYELICSDVNDVDIRKLTVNAGQFEVRQVSGTKFNTKISLDEDFWSHYDKAPFTMRASVFIHEVCHATMSKVRGNLMNLGGCDLEYPCYLRGNLLNYKFGYYNDTKDPYKAMLEDRKICGTKIAGPNNYCRRASFEITGVSEGQVVLKNNGTEDMHCMMLELSIDGVLHPVDCGYVLPGKTAVIRNEYLKESSVATLRIFGCEEKVRVNFS